MNESIRKELVDIERNNPAWFYGAVCDMFGKGEQFVSQISLDEVRKEADAENKKIEEKGNIPLMTTDFQVEIIQLEQKLSKFQITDLMEFCAINYTLYNKIHKLESDIEDYKIALETIIDDTHFENIFNNANDLCNDIGLSIEQYRDIVGDSSLYCSILISIS